MKKFSLFFMLVVAGIVSVLAGTPSFAATFNVTTSAELQLALTTAESNDEDDTINIAAGTYSTNGTTFTYAAASDETHSLTLKGAGAGSTILDGGYIVQVLQIVTPPSQDPSGASITIEDLTIQNGFTTGVAGGGLLLGNFYTSTVSHKYVSGVKPPVTPGVVGRPPAACRCRSTQTDGQSARSRS